MKSMPVTTNPPGGKWAEGGNHPMHKWSGTGKQEPGQSAQEGSGPKRGIAPKAGPSGVSSSDYSNKKHGSNKDFAGCQEAGTSGPTKEGSNSKFAEGGKGHMFGNRGSLRAEGGKTSP